MKGTHTFCSDIPYHLTESGGSGDKPLIVYLHGYKQNAAYLQKKTEQLQSLNAWHLFLNGPYPVYDEKHKRRVEKWGRAWYLYDGGQEQFIASLEKTATFIDEILEDARSTVGVDRVAVLGYSMGGYLAGYYGLSRPDAIDDLVVIGGRIKTESFEKKNYKNLNVLALHGKNDQSVDVARVQASCEDLRNRGARTTFKILPEEHRLSVNYIRQAKKWMLNADYTEIK